MITAAITDGRGMKLSALFDHDGQAGRDLLTGLSGWAGGVGIRSEDVARLSHGSFPTPTTRAGRTLTVDMLFERDTRAELWALERATSGLFGDGGYGTLTVTQDGAAAFCEVRLDGDVKPIAHLDSGYLTVQVPLHAPVPWIYSPWRESTLQPIGAGIGLEYPVLGGGVVAFGAAVQATEPVWNDGNADSWARFVVTADSPAGFAVGLAGRRVTYPWPTWMDIPVTVDMAGSVTVGGVDQSHLLGERGWAHTGPHSIEQPTFELLQGGTGFCTVQHRDTYI